MIQSRTLILLMLLTFQSAVSQATENEVALVLDSFHLAASEANGEQYFAQLADDAVFIGTDASERWNKKEFKAFAQGYFDKGVGWTYLARDRHISLSADAHTAWFDELLDNKKYGECRGTGVLVNTSQGWKISQYHLTIPLPNELAGQIVKQIFIYKNSRTKEQ